MFADDVIISCWMDTFSVGLLGISKSDKTLSRRLSSSSAPSARLRMSLTLRPVTVVAVDAVDADDTDETSDAAEIGLKLTVAPFGGTRSGRSSKYPAEDL